MPPEAWSHPPRNRFRAATLSTGRTDSGVVMNDRIQHLLAQMAAVEDELRDALHEQETSLLYRVKDKQVEFEQSVKQTHRRLKTGFFRWLVTYRPQNLITGPVIYGMIVPLAILDLFVTLYQASCFPIYRIAKVRRSDYIVLDRHQLEYLNAFEKFHCSYCAYASGLIAYVYEIVARTEQYFCPIKHARKILGTHSRYRHFLDYGEAEDYEVRLETFRNSLDQVK
jgi:hypothetical protein